MTNNNSYDKFYLANKKRLKDIETKLECSVNLDCAETVNKILAVNVEGNVTGVESLTGEATVNGNIYVSIVYATEKGLVGNAFYSAPFITKSIDSLIKPESKVFAKVNFVDAKVESLNSNVAKVFCRVNLSVVCVNNENIDYLSNVAGDICAQSELSNFTTFSGVTRSNWQESIDVVIKEPLNKVLSSTCDVHINSVECATGFVNVNCEIVNKIMYLTDEEQPQIKTVYTKTDVKQEIESEYVSQGSFVDLDLFVVKSEVKNVISEKEDDIKIVIEVPLDVCIRVYENKEVELITDLYSTEKLTNLTTHSYENSVICDPIKFEKKVEGSLSLSDDEPRIDKLLAVNYSKAIVTNQYLENGLYTVSGVITSNLIYFNEDDVMPNSVDVEIPFVVSHSTELEGNILTDLSVTAVDVDVMVKKGRDVYIDALLVVTAFVCKTVTGAVISELNYADSVPLKDCSIEIYFAKKGEKVWDIAKKLFVKPETIFIQNPNISDILENDEKLAIYYQKTKN